MAGVATAIGGAALVGGIMQSQAAKSAAHTQAQAAQQAAQTQQSMYQQTRGDLAPYNQAGQSATQALMSFYGLPGGKGPTSDQLAQKFANLPGYQFMFGQGEQALARQAASMGHLQSGGFAKELTRYGQGYAQANAVAPYVQGLQSLAGQGENAAAQSGAFGTKAGEGIAQTQMAGGSAMAAGQVGSANALAGGLGTAAGFYGMNQIYQQNRNWNPYQQQQQPIDYSVPSWQQSLPYNPNPNG